LTHRTLRAHLSLFSRRHAASHRFAPSARFHSTHRPRMAHRRGDRLAGPGLRARDGPELPFMATKRMLVDGTHPEETRIVVTNGNKLDAFEFESQRRRQLRGNIYLAKVTRVEPSLQAAFVEYGGNRHGFLAFSEILPDYYQIPVADREALMRAEEDEDQHDDHDHEP